MKDQVALGDIAGAEAAIKGHEAKTAEKLEQVKAVTAATESVTAIEAAIKPLQASLDEAKANETKPADTTELDSLSTQITEWEAKLGPRSVRNHHGKYRD